MSKQEAENKECQDKTKIRKDLSIDTTKTEIIKEVAEKLEEILDKKEENLNSTDEFGDRVQEILDSILDDFKDSLSENEEKKSFVSGLVEIFSILLRTRYNSITKLKKIIRITAEIALNFWPEQKQQ